jgi:radical SAM protein with 4Fe4S-binding SPASM domain
MCPQSELMTREKGMMDIGLYKRIIDEAKSFVWCLQLFHTGEALLHPDIHKMIKYAYDAGMYTVINTNACLLSEEKASQIIDANLSQISFSFDGPTPEAYEQLRVGASFDNVMNNIKLFLKMKKQKKAKYPYTIVEVIPMQETKAELNSFLKQLRNLGVDDVRLWGYHHWIHAEHKNDTDVYYPCEYPYTIMAVYWDGRVVPCCMDYNAGYVVGDVRYQSLQEIWNSTQLQKLRYALRNRDTYQQIELCKNCSFLTSPKTYISIFGKMFKLLANIVGRCRR